MLLIGGGAKSEALRRIAPAVFGVPVVVPPAGEYVADGAARQAAYVRELERVVDKCTSRGENSIVIDGEVWLCGAVPTGAKI